MQQLQLPKLRKVDPNKPKKKKILLLSDDLRMHSGIATMSREIVLNSCQEFDWVQLGAAIQHPDMGKVIDISSDLVKETGVEDASVKLIESPAINCIIKEKSKYLLFKKLLDIGKLYNISGYGL